jgi:Na+/H+-dicarboxylate symporter
MKQQNSKMEESNPKIPQIKAKNNKKEPIKKTKKKSSFNEQLAENLILIATIIAVILGIGIGFILREYYTFNRNEVAYFRLPGDLFLRMLKFLILPLITSSLISGISGLGSANAGKIAIRSLTYYFSTTIIAVITGIILVVLIQPGGGVEPIETDINIPIDPKKVTTTDTFLDLIRLLI